MIRNPVRIIYASSYDRGLEHLLDMWPDVYKEVKEKTGKISELHVFYGWNLFDAIMGNNPERMAWKQKMNDKMKENGIWHHGRVSHQELIGNMKVSSVWAYPTHFGEISCQVAMMAQAYGCIPVVINYAALKETVNFGDRIDGDINDPLVQKQYQKALIDRMIWCNNQLLNAEKLRQTMMEWAKKQFTWEAVAQDWDKNLLT